MKYDNKLLNILRFDMLPSNKVEIYKNNETGKWLYAVRSYEDKDLWIESFSHKQDAYDYCVLHKLEVVNII